MEKIRLMVAGTPYNISTDDDLDYVAALGAEIDKKVTGLVNSNARISVTQAAVLTALEYADAYKKSEATSENLRSQIKSYLEDAAVSRSEAEIAKKEIKRLKKELNSLKGTK